MWDAREGFFSRMPKADENALSEGISDQMF